MSASPNGLELLDELAKPGAPLAHSVPGLVPSDVPVDDLAAGAAGRLPCTRIHTERRDCALGRARSAGDVQICLSPLPSVRLLVISRRSPAIADGLLGRRQVVRHRFLVPAFAGS